MNGFRDAAAIALRDSRIEVSGAVTFSTVPKLAAQARAWLTGVVGPAVIDLGAVERIDSAGLALLVEWLQLARAHGSRLSFQHVPEQVRRLVAINGLDAVFDPSEPACASA